LSGGGNTSHFDRQAGGSRTEARWSRRIAGYINIGHRHDLGGDWGKTAMKRRAHDVLDVAWRSGIRYFDSDMLHSSRLADGPF
jgi:aryl-alcohol dehydrogenase-like predicted oxidoreductase